MASKAKPRKASKSKSPRTAKKAVKRAKKPAFKKVSSSLVNFKIGRRERAELVAKAKRYTGGVVSAWIRLAATKYAPSRKEVRAHQL